MIDLIGPGSGLGWVRVYISYDCRFERVGALAIVLAYMRSKEWEEPSDDVRPSHVPNGIHIRKDCKFNVKYTKTDGSFAFKTLTSMDDAIAFQADPLCGTGVDSTDHDESELVGQA